MRAIGTIITVYRGGCEVVEGGRVRALALTGRHARSATALAVGDEVTFDAVRGWVEDILPRRTQLARQRTRGRAEQVIAANMDRVAIVVANVEPPFRSGLVDRFLLAARAGGLEAILVANKIDLLAGGELPEEIAAYGEVLPLYAISAHSGQGLESFRGALRDSRTVLAGHSGVGKSALLNALEPELRLETGELRARDRRGRHTTSRASWIQLAGGAVVVDTPGVREIATGPVPRELLQDVYPEVVERAQRCRFRDCRHGQEPDCAVREAVEQGELRPGRLASYRRLLDEISG